MDAYQFWVKVFALTFALGVVSDITMSLQFGTNWPGFMNTVGNVAGPLLAYEVLTVAFLLAGLSAYRWLKGDKGKAVQASLRTVLFVAAALIPLQIVVGDQHGLNTLHHQPAKNAAVEGMWETQKGAPAVLFAMPDKTTQTNKYQIAIPKMAYVYVTHEWDGEIKGIKEFGDQHPPVAPVFWAFCITVGVGMTFAGWVALIAGWYVT